MQHIKLLDQRDSLSNTGLFTDNSQWYTLYRKKQMNKSYTAKHSFSSLKLHCLHTLHHCKQCYRCSCYQRDKCLLYKRYRRQHLCKSCKVIHNSFFFQINISFIKNINNRYYTTLACLRITIRTRSAVCRRHTLIVLQIHTNDAARARCTCRDTFYAGR